MNNKIIYSARRTKFLISKLASYSLFNLLVKVSSI